MVDIPIPAEWETLRMFSGAWLNSSKAQASVRHKAYKPVAGAPDSSGLTLVVVDGGMYDC